MTSMPHLQRVRDAIIKANEHAKTPHAPKADDVKQTLIDLIKVATDALSKL
jgi:hypothetical protein